MSHFRGASWIVPGAADAPLAAIRTFQGIVVWAGPALPWTNTRQAYEILRKAARTAAFEEIPSYRATVSQWHKCYDRWCWNRDRILSLRISQPSAWPDPEESPMAPDQAPWE